MDWAEVKRKCRREERRGVRREEREERREEKSIGNQKKVRKSEN
jgi:hypothetical protein